MIVRSYQETRVNKGGKVQVEKEGKVQKKLVDDKGDQYEEEDEFRYSDKQAKIQKANQKAINRKVIRVEEDEDLKTKAKEKRRQLKNMKDEEVPEFESKWNTKAKEYKFLQSDTKKAISN
jgi:hypothetical protein